MDKKIKILLVDDEADFLDPMAYFFESNGYLVTKASTGEDALKAVKESTPDIVFLDIILPDIDGLAVLRRIREFNQTLPVIMMSAYVKDDKLEKGLHFHGRTDIYYKGDSLSKALTLLESALKTDKKIKEE